MVTVLPAWAGRRRGDPPVGQGSSWHSLSRPLGGELIPSTGAEMASRADMHGGKSEPGQAVWTLWDDARRETSPIKHLALK